MTPARAILSPVIAAVAILQGAGCSTLNLDKASLPWPMHNEKQYGTPRRIIAVWADTVYQQPGKPATRGFGGRIYFYDGDRKGIPVDGQLVVYAYDDTSPEATFDRPTRKYAFTAEQLTRYYSESDLGASYNIWIPWDKVGGEEKQVSLYPVFVDKSGKMLCGNFSNNRLPGHRVLTERERRGFYVSRKNAHQQLAGNSADSVQQAHYQAQATKTPDAAPEKHAGLQTTTIRIPRSLAERMAAAPPFLSGTLSPGRQSTPAPPGSPDFPPHSDNAVSRYSTNDAARRYGQSPSTDGHAITTQPTGAAPRYATNTTGIPNPPLGKQGYFGADPRHSVSATSRAWARQHEQSARFEPPRFRVPAKPGVQRHLGRETIPPSPSAPQSHLPATY